MDAARNRAALLALSEAHALEPELLTVARALSIITPRLQLQISNLVMSQQQQQENLEEQIRALREKLRAAIDDLRHMHEQYKSNSDLQVELPFLEHWFPKRISTFEDWAGKIRRALNDEDFRKSSSFEHFLGGFRSLGRALDADTQWSERDTPLHIKSGEMSNLARKIRKQIDVEERL